MDEQSSSGSTVQRSAYRQPVTAKGLKAIEDGSLTWLDDEMYNNLNTGVLEQYLEEKISKNPSKFLTGHHPR